MRIGDGIEPTILDDMVKIPHELAIPWERESLIQKLIQETFSQLQLHTWDASYMVQKAILSPKNENVEKLKNMIIIIFQENNIIYCHLMKLKETHMMYTNK